MAMLYIVLSLFLINVAFGYISNETKIEEYDENLFLSNMYKEMDKGLKYLVEKNVKNVLRQFLQTEKQMDLSSDCISNIITLISGVRSLKPWAISFLDANGKPSDGLMSGNTNMLGNYDQCLASFSKKKNGDIYFQGRYCLMTFKPYLPNLPISATVNEQMTRIFMITRNISELLQQYILKSQLMSYYEDRYGLCVPSGCVKEDVEEIAKYFGNISYLNLTVEYCHMEEDISYLNTRKIGIMSIFVAFGFICLVGSIIDYFCRVTDSTIKSNKAVKGLLCFSVITNFPRLINTDVSEKSLSCLHGIRVLTIFYIILGHHYITKSMFPMMRNAVPNIFMHFHDFFMQIVVNGFLSVDIFFLIGGFINCYIQLNVKKMDNSPRNVWQVILHRLWRLYPPYVFTILLQLLLTSRGPVSYVLVDTYVEKCSESWWKNLLFVNNFLENSKVCLGHSWYIACDMQYFLISLIVIPLIARRPKLGILVNVAIILCCLTSTALWVWLKRVPPTFLFNNVSKKDLLLVMDAYVLPFTHAAPYFIGVLMGYIISIKKEIKIPMVYQIIGWILASFCYTSMLFMTLRWNSGTMYTPTESVLYFTFSRPFYALPVAWMTFCCITGHGGVINYILSLKIWIPLSRMTFMLYLISFPIQMFYNSNLRTTLDTQTMVFIWNYFGDLCVCSFLALIMVLIIESPCVALEKLAFSWKVKKNACPRIEPSINNGYERDNIDDVVIENQTTAMENGISLTNYRGIRGKLEEH